MLGGQSIPLGGFVKVSGDAVAILVQLGKEVLRVGVALLGSHAEPSDSGSTEPVAGQTEEAAPETMIMTASKPEPSARVTLPAEGLQLELLSGRTPDREAEGQVEFDLTPEEYDLLLAQLDESGLDYTAEESGDAGSGTVLVVVEAAN